MKKRVSSLLLALIVILNLVFANALTVSADDSGMTFNTGAKDDVWRMRKPLAQAPYTFSAWIKVPTDAGDSRIGGIMSNYDGGSDTSTFYGNSTYTNRTIIFEIHNNGNPRFFYGIDNNGSLSRDSLVFDSVDVRTGEWMNLTIVKEPAAVICYVNGVEAQRFETSSVYHSDILLQPFAFGGDNRKSNQYPFKGAIKGFSLYTSPLTAAQVSTLYSQGVDLQDPSLLLNYDLATAPTGDYIEDTSANDYYAAKSTYVSPVDSENNIVIGEKGTGSLGSSGSGGDGGNDTGSGGDSGSGSGTGGSTERDYAYSFAVVGDTQYMTKYDGKVGSTSNHLSYVYDWLVQNVDKKNIKYVMGLGDITDSFNKNGTYRTAVEWEIALTQISKLDGLVPYSLVRGNHDNPEYMNNTFANSSYMCQFTDPDLDDQSKCFYEKGSILNAYTKFTVGETKYLLLMLDDNPTDGALEWASDIVAKNPEYRVIVTTHTYLGYTGEHIDGTDPSWAYAVKKLEADKGENDGVQIWEKFISRHRNIFLVLCGHDYKGQFVQTQREGIHGNTVTEMLICPQSLDSDKEKDVKRGMVAMLYFSEDGKDVRAEYISTALTLTSETGEDKVTKEMSFNLISHEKNELAAIEYIKTVGNVDVYACWLENGLCRTFEVTHKAGGAATTVSSVEKTASVGLVDTYTITFSDGTTAQFTVTNGEKGETGAAGAPGATGATGATGADGKNGADGKDGAPGAVIAAITLGGVAMATDVGLLAVLLRRRKR